MGILGNILAGKRANGTTVGNTTAEGQYIPATCSGGTAVGLPASMGSIVERAGQFYKANPKKVHALGAVAAAILLTSMGKRR